ncbi:MAG: class I SAM-dependent methyltransferase [Magnetococcales bacterium]|nr:methyltransferase domain-containing protein [Magnetococcales bacterium]NGZ05080.1 class I SAM-dependent methyltransferase [Magnetococcales bacterium]
MDALRLQTWYATPLGQTSARLIGEAMDRWLRQNPGNRTLGCGFPQPYLEGWRSCGGEWFGASPAEMGVVRWPVGGNNRMAQVRPDALPFSSEYFDRVIMTHLLEGVYSLRATLRETWRVLVPGGRVLVVVPNRGGLWARRDVTPFGYGRPFSPGQLRHALEESLFLPCQSCYALFIPPFAGQRWLGAAAAWEKAGQRWFAPLGGVILCEAEKVVYAVPKIDAGNRRAVRARPVPIPVGNHRSQPDEEQRA